MFRRQKWHPYKLQLIQALAENDIQSRIIFYNAVILCIQQQPDFIRQVLWSDESTFTNTGAVNWHNMVYWADRNPRWFHEQIRWSGILGNSIIESLFLEDDLNGERFLDFLQTRLIDGDLLKDVPLQLATHHWLHMVGAPAHYHLMVQAFLHFTCPKS
ncbi:hypothetical protein ANN_26111 [Periplaneta americana]|uniref:Uncharacterized protein n=1 Tax=Periplaneta americana TaxID=6978 RepID=A0ABQ8S5I7_PERAM|nr:hypothetical protein ANN_26111 [Periplaneta americana]